MGEYTGRRRGRAASEPSPQQPEYLQQPEYAPQEGYFGYPDPYAQQQQPEGYEQQQYGHEYAPEYAQDPGYGYQDAPSYEQHPSFEQHQGQEQQPYYEYGSCEPYEQGYAQEYQAEYAEGYQQEPYYEQPYTEQPYTQPDYGYTEQGYAEQPYVEQGYGYAEQPYAQPYNEQGYSEQGYAEQGYSEQGYSEQGYEQDPYGEYAEPCAEDYREPYDHPESYAYPEPAYPAPAYAPDGRTPLSLGAHLPFIAAATAALAVTAFVSAKAVAAVVLPLQLVVAWAVLDLAGFASRRTAVVLALPVIAGTLATFKFQADESATAVGAGLGAGFVLLAADAVLRTARRGVEPGTVRSLAAAGSALLFAGLTGLFLPAAALHLTSVAAGAAVCGLGGLVAARNPELGVSRAAVVAIPVTIAALASYAAAILVP